MHDSALHLASERKNVQGVQQIFNFLLGADMGTLQQALQPYCRRLRLPMPSTPSEAVRMAANMANTKGQTPLMYASYASAPEVARELLNQGADPWQADRCGCRNALHYAAMSGSAACVEALLRDTPPALLTRQGIRLVNCRSLSGLTPLHYAVFFEHEAAVEELLKHEPNINAATTAESFDVWLTYATYSTPMHFAAFKNYMPAARMLLLHYARRRHSGTVLDPRLRRNSAGMMPWQVAHGRPLGSMLHPAVPLASALAALGGPEVLDLEEQVGPPLLAAIAAAALRQKLLAEVEVIEREVVEQEEEQQKQAAHRSLLLCGSQRRGTRSAWRDMSRHISRTLSRSASRAASGRMPRVPTATTLPSSPRRAPTLDRLDGAPPHPSEYPGAESLYSVGTQQSQAAVSPGVLPGRVVRTGARRSCDERVSGGGAATAAGGGGLPRPRSGRLKSGRPQASGGGHYATTGGASNYSALGLSSTPVGAYAGTSAGGGMPAGGSPTASLYPTFSAGTPGLYSAYSGGAGYAPAGGSPPPGRMSYPALGALGAGPGTDPAGGSPVSLPRSSQAPTQALGATNSSGGVAKVGSGELPALKALAFPALGAAPGPSAAKCRASAPGDPEGGSPCDSGSQVLPSGGSPPNSTVHASGQRAAAAWTTPRGGSPRGSSPVRQSVFAMVGSALGMPSGVSAFAAAAAGAGAGAGAEALQGGPSLGQPVGVGLVGTATLSPAASLRAGSVGFVGGEANDDEEFEGVCGVCFARREAVSPALCHHGLCAVCAGELCRAVVNRPLLCPFCRQVVTRFVRVVTLPAQ